MKLNDSLDLEDIFFSYIDEFKIFLFPDQWLGFTMDYSKNEMLVLLYLYRYNSANMTELSEYINAPLNTTTGVINRLEKKEIVERIRSSEDRRVVQITLTEKAKLLLAKEKKVLEHYFQKIYKALTEEEMSLAMRLITKVMNAIKEGKSDFNEEETKKKIKKITIE